MKLNSHWIFLVTQVKYLLAASIKLNLRLKAVLDLFVFQVKLSMIKTKQNFLTYNTKVGGNNIEVQLKLIK